MILLEKHHRDIVFYKALCNLRSEASKTYLSVLWWVLEPIFLMAIYYIVFAIIFQSRTENFVMFLLVGLVVWQWFSQCINHCAASINNNKALISQVNFPRIILPSINVVMDTFKFSIVFVLLLVTLWIMGFPPNWSYLYLPLILALNFMLIYACGILVATLVPFIPDLSNVIPHLLRLGFYGSGILYAVSRLPEKLQQYMGLNPMVWIIDSYRNVLMYNKVPETSAMLAYAIGVLSLYAVARLTIEHMNPRFARALMQR